MKYNTMKYNTMKEFINAHINKNSDIIHSNTLDEGFIDSMKKGYHSAFDAVNKATYSVIPRDVLPKPQDNIHMNGVDVNRLNASHVSHYHIHAHFQPTHNIKVHIPGSTSAHGSSVIYVVGNELGSHGPQVYRKDHTGSYTKVDHIRLLHENKDIVRTHIGQQIYNANKHIFKVLPLSATRGDIRRLMSMNPNDNIHGHSVKSLQKLAVNHYNSTPAIVNHLLNNPNVDQMVLQQSVIKHGLTRKQAEDLLRHPNVTHTVLKDAANNRLLYP